jgi:hypothetical protein
MLLCAPLALGQGIYKWTDARGQVHYGEAPPEDAPAAEVTVKTAPVSGDSPPPATDHSAATKKLLDTFQEERANKEEAEARHAKEEEKRKRNCAIARDNLRQYKDANELYTLDKKGERQILDASQHAAALRQAEAEVAKYCK